MKVVFLGTSGSMPTTERGSSSIAVVIGREVLLLDCGEGTQRQMIAAHISIARVKRILISHTHGDHVLGLPGLLQSMTLQRREEPLDIYGPRGTHAFLQAVSDTIGGPSFPTMIHELTEPGLVYETRSYKVETARADHRLEAWAYSINEKSKPGKFHPNRARALSVPEGSLWKRLQEGEDVIVEGTEIKSAQVVDPPKPGLKLVYSGDTRPSEAVIKIATKADVLIHEATFNDDLVDRAAEDGHSTVSQAAEIAIKASVKRLVITHISSRYSDELPLLEAAQKLFSDTTIARDFLILDILSS